MITRNKNGCLTVVPALTTLACLTMGLVWSAPAVAADTCTGWGGSSTKTIELNLPPSLDLTTTNSHANAVLASGSVALTPLACESSSGQEITATSQFWYTGSPAGPDIRTVAPGLGLRLKYVPVGGGYGTLSAVNATAGQTSGLNWQAVNWELIRLSDTLTPGTLPSARLLQISLDTRDSSGNSPTLNLISASPVVVSAACTLSVDKSLIELPETSTRKMMEEGYSDGVSLRASVTCPGNTRINNGTSLMLSSATLDSTDPSLVGNTGTASGVGIEVLDQHGKRVSASSGEVEQPPFTQQGVGAPGAIQDFTVRMIKHVGETVEPGTVLGTFTLTLTVN